MKNFEDIFKNVSSWNECKENMVLFANNNYSLVGKELFEKFAKYYFLCNPSVKNDYKKVWLYNEIPYEIKEKLNLPNKDYGIDLILQNNHYEFVAVQCKFKLDENKKLCWTKDKIGNFFGSTNKVDGYIVFSNAFDIDEVSQTRNQHFQFINITDLLEIKTETFLAISDFLNNSKVKNQLLSPKPHQETAIQNAVNYYANNNIGKLILPCGAGKTLTSLWIKEALNTNSTLVILPSLSLLRQFKNEWKSQSKQQFDYLCVCSDSDIDNDDDTIKTKTYQVDIKVSSNPEEIRQFLEREAQKIIFSTYQSLDKVRDSIAKTDIFFDFSICDEAHRTAGMKNKDTKESNYTLIHDNSQINVKNRLFMTATPRVASINAKTRAKDGDVYLYCMDDENLFGKEIYRMSFADAIDEGILVDYKIVAIGISKEEISQYLNNKRLELPNYSLDDIANNYAVEFILDEYSLNHAVTFHTRVKYAESFENIHKKITNETIAFSINGKNSSTERSLKLNSFKKNPRAVISNAKCLTEGVDIPAIDAVFFCDPKNSKIDIVQAAGRALRKADGKKIGYIIIPIYHSQKTKKEDVIAGLAFKRLIDVIKAMADHDERLQDEIDAIASGKRFLKSDSKIDYIEKGVSNDEASNIKESPIKLLNFNEDLKQYYFSEIIEKASDGWNLNFQKFCNWLKENNGSYPTKEENLNLYAWTMAQRQRTRKNINKLSPERINKLNEINFIWDQHEHSWNEKYQKLIEWKNINPDSLKWPSQRSKEPVEHELAVWFLKLRSDYKKGIIGEERFNKLVEINFPFDPHLDKWMVIYEQLKEFINKNGRFPSPAQDKKGDKFYMWLRGQIDKFSKLSKNQQKLLEEINYQDFESQFNSWGKNYDKLAEFIQNNQRLPRPDHKKGEINLYNWFINQRRQFKDDKLEKDQIDSLLSLEFVNDFFQLEEGKRQARSLKKSLARCEELAEFRKNNPERWPSMASSNSKQEKDLCKWLMYIKNWYSGKLKNYYDYTNEFPKELYDELLKIGFDFHQFDGSKH